MQFLPVQLYARVYTYVDSFLSFDLELMNPDLLIRGPPPPYHSYLPKGVSADQFRQERNSQCGYLVINPDDDSDEGKLYLYSLPCWPTRF